jgi:hypothetical protein
MAEDIFLKNTITDEFLKILTFEADKQKALAEQGKEFVGMIFRNPVVMTNAMKETTYSTNSGGYTNTGIVMQPDNKTTTTI